MKKISVIIPHYNSSKKLERLLKSIPLKYEKEIEIILVDDKSNEKEKEAIKRLLKTYTNAKFYSNESSNKNAGAARNIGLKYLDTEWVLFADADDFFLENSFDRIFEYLDTDYDIVYFNVTSIYENSLEIGNRHVYLENLIKEHDKDKDMIRYKYFVPWGKLIKTNLIKTNDIYFDEVQASNDCFFSIKTGHYAQKIKVDLNKIYTVTRDRGSLTTSVSKEIFDCRFNVWLNVNKFIKEKTKKKYQKPMLEYIVKSLDYGVINFFKVYFKVLKEKNKVLPENILNYKILVSKIKKYLKEKKEIKRYNKEKS